jgi:hypothetical protein
MHEVYAQAHAVIIFVCNLDSASPSVVSLQCVDVL